MVKENRDNLSKHTLSYLMFWTFSLLATFLSLPPAVCASDFNRASLTLKQSNGFLESMQIYCFNVQAHTEKTALSQHTWIILINVNE